MRLVVLGNYRTSTQANLVKSRLEAEGIAATVSADVSSLGLPPLELAGGVQVVVREADRAAAYEVLERMLPG
ncbi:MAG: putative signal transducing protein [Acidimicrobiia bacterium]